jgi:hypothetical protein
MKVQCPNGDDEGKCKKDHWDKCPHARKHKHNRVCKTVTAHCHVCVPVEE